MKGGKAWQKKKRKKLKQLKRKMNGKKKKNKAPDELLKRNEITMFLRNRAIVS